MLTKIINGERIIVSNDEEQELLSQWAEEDIKREEKLKLSYVKLRQRSYPQIGDQLDALLKQFEAMKVAGVTIDTDLQTIIDQWNAVKLQYPKPKE